MKKIYFFFLLVVSQCVSGQNNVGIGVQNPDPSAILELSSPGKGFLIPRMPGVQRLAIPAPATGLMVFDTDSTCVFLYNGTIWKNLCVSQVTTNDSIYLNPNGTISFFDGAHSVTTPLSAWLTVGNQGTNSTTNFAGTIDAQDFVLKSNNAEVQRMTTTGAVGINQPSPAAGAILDVVSSTKGVLVPRTTIAQIAAPSLGLMIFDTDTNCFVFYTGSGWRNLCAGNAFNDSVYINPNGTISVLDGGGVKTSPQSAWTTTGNSGTNSATNFAGTTDAQDFVIRSNNTEVMRATTGGAVGINQPAPNANAILDIQSTAKGVLFPSLTTAQRDAIVGPVNGLTIYNNTINVHQFWNGTCWVNVGQTVCAFDYALSISHPSDCLLSSNFSSVSDTITISLVAGTPSPVILSASGVPAGVLLNFSNSYVTPTQTSIMTVTALPSAQQGTFTITVLASSGSTIQTVTYSLTVYSYNLVLAPTSGTVNEIAITPNNLYDTTTVTIGNPGACGSAGTNALLSVNGLPVGVTAAFGNSNLAIPGSTSLIFTSSSCAVPGTYTVQVVAQVGALSSSTNYTITVAPSVINITASTNNVNLFNLAGTPSCPITLTVNVSAGVQVGSASNAQAALTTGAFPSGSSITINNNGTIAGAGGNGGDDVGYGGAFTNCPNVDGGAGGTAIDLACSGVIINNAGVIGGGGGGGGAGGGLSGGNPCFQNKAGTGGGGGAGSVPGSGGTNGGGGAACSAGSNGTAVTGGNGGPAGACGVSCFLSFGTTYYPGTGGNGGNLGQAGGAGGNAVGFFSIGSTGVCPPGNGGAAGCGIKTNGNTYSVNGTAVVGPVCP